MAALDLVSGDERNVFDNLFRTSGDFGLPARKRGIGERQVSGDCGAITVMLGKGSGARFGGAAAEIFAVVGHARFLLSFSRPHAGHAYLLRRRDDCESRYGTPAR
jgi:hypothetical protein